MESNEEIKEVEKISEEEKKNIIDILNDIKTSQDLNEVYPQKLFDLLYYINDIKEKEFPPSPEISDLFTDNYIFLFRTLLLQEKGIRIVILKLLRNNIQIYPPFTKKLLDALYPLAICRVLEEFKKNPFENFEERYECLKLLNIWLKYSDNNFPLIFCQAIAAMAKSDALFKKGCIEFIRNLGVIRPDLCSTIGGFRILISCLLDENFEDMNQNIFNSILYIINSPKKRKYFNGFNDLYKIFAVFTKSDFCVEVQNTDKDNNNANNKQLAEKEEEKNKLNLQLQISKKLIKKLLNTWPGYSLIMGDYMSMGSVIRALNTDTNITIKTAILNLLKEIIEDGFNYLDNFTNISSPSKDQFYANKVFFAYILQGLQDNNLYENLIKFIEEDSNSSMSDYAHKLALKYTILYSKLSNNDLQLPFLNEKIEKQKVLEEMNMGMNFGMNMNLGINGFNQVDNKYNELDEEVANMKVKIMHLLDQTFYHFNCKDNAAINIDTLSSDIIIAVHSCLYLQNIKKYDNQYYIDSCKKELFSKDEESFTQSLKNSKILDTKEYNLIDWRHIDTILDIADTRRELIIDLHKQKFFKKLLFNFMPSKNILVKQQWAVSNFSYCAIGNKLFKLISTCSDLNTILDSFPDDFILKKGLTWLEDVMQCLDNLLTKNVNEDKDNPFQFRRVYNSLSRNIFSFIGILSQTTSGDEYLFKKNFYTLLDKFVTNSNKYDYLLTCIIDNLNFNSKNVSNWLIKLISQGSAKIKRYIFDHIRCLIKYGKDIRIDIETMINSLDKSNQDCNEVIIDILKIIFLEGRNIDPLIHNKSLIEKTYEIDKSLMYILMRKDKIFDGMSENIDKEIKELNMDNIINEYSNELKESMKEVFEDSEESENKYYLRINLTKIENQYENYNEFYFLKQLPFNISFSFGSSPNDKKDEILITYFEYHKNNILLLVGTPLESSNTNFDPRKQIITIKCGLGKAFIDNKTSRPVTDSSNVGIVFNSSDMGNLIKSLKNADKKEAYTLYKKGVTIFLKKGKKDNNFILDKIFIRVKINPSISKSVQTPINIITELNNNRNGYSKLVDNKIVEKLFKYLDIENLDKNSNKIKSVLWILAKLLIKDNQGELETNYKIVKKIIDFNQQCNDYAMKGTISYILCYISQNKIIKNILETYDYSYFFNTDICYPNDIREIYLDNKSNYINRKLNEEVDKINKLITLNSTTEEIYNNFSCYINNISYKQANSELDEMNKNNSQMFYDLNLLIKVYILLSKYKLKQTPRKNILHYIEKAISSNEFAQEVNKIFSKVGKDILTGHELD
jgi:hypothetical protein